MGHTAPGTEPGTGRHSHSFMMMTEGHWRIPALTSLLFEKRKAPAGQLTSRERDIDL